VLATARDIGSLTGLSERYGDQVKLFALDVTDELAAAGAVKTAIDAFGSLDVVINNAGYGNLSSVEDTPISDFRAQIETNLFGTIIVTKASRSMPTVAASATKGMGWNHHSRNPPNDSHGQIQLKE
jgi:NAD(P)-dependent dehydrogenase (short-subunit alcohol dehydrogenase family)